MLQFYFQNIEGDFKQEQLMTISVDIPIGTTQQTSVAMSAPVQEANIHSDCLREKKTETQDDQW